MLPAHAGMIRRLVEFWSQCFDAPRTRGDDPMGVDLAISTKECLFLK